MKPITYRNLDEPTRGIPDGYADQELRTNDLCRQIFERYNYNPVTPLNFETEPFGKFLNEGTDNGIDDVIYVYDIPKDDPLNLKQFKPSKWDDVAYNIDYKSNNARHLDSIYVKLMVYRSIREYQHSYEKKGRTIYPFKKHMEIDKRKWEEARKKGKDTIRSQMDYYYGNRWILSDTNKTEYFFYVKHTEPEDPLETSLICAYLVPALLLKKQVADTLNRIFEKYDHELQIRLEHDFDLNKKIMTAYKLCEGEERDSNQIELFKPRWKKDILLRIPENLLISHIKFNEYGNIITN